MVSSSSTMDKDAIEEHYLKVTKRFANLAGTWPYQARFPKIIIVIVSYIVVIPAVYTQIAHIVLLRNLDIVMEEFPFVAVSIGTLIKQATCIIYGERFKILLNGMYEDWTTNRSKEEIEIITNYAERATYFTSFYAVTACSSTFFFINMPYISLVMDQLIPLNESRDILFVYRATYPFDEKKYFYVITMHMASLIVLILFVFTASDTIFIYFVQHACGLLEVSGHRFKYAIGDSSICEIKKIVESPEEIYRKVCHSIQAHERAIAYLNEIRDIYLIYFIIFMTLVTMAFSVSLVKLSAMEINGNAECCFYCVFLFVQLMHIFFMVFQGQFVINATDNVYEHIYEALWYNAPAKTQALFVLALRRTLNAPEISAGGLVTFNLQSFSAMIKTSVSYFTVLKST